MPERTQEEDIEHSFSERAAGSTVADCPSQSKSAADASKVTKNRIDIVFDPDKSTEVKKCEKIVHVQFLRMTVDGKVIKPTDLIADWKYRDPVVTDDGWFIDHLKTETSPDYQQGKGEGKKDGAVKKDATMYDAPNIGDDTVMGVFDASTNKGGWKSILFEFYTYAWCMKGTDCGHWYEGVKWQYTKTYTQHSKGETGESKILDDNVSPPPGASQVAAFDKFNKNKSFKPCS